MPVATLTLQVCIPWARSLKDRRQVIRSLKDRLRQAFNASIAELDDTPAWQSATIGVAAISKSHPYLQGQMEQIETAALRILEEQGAELTDAWCEFVD